MKRIVSVAVALLGVLIWLSRSPLDFKHVRLVYEEGHTRLERSDAHLPALKLKTCTFAHCVVAVEGSAALCNACYLYADGGVSSMEGDSLTPVPLAPHALYRIDTLASDTLMLSLSPARSWELLLMPPAGMERWLARQMQRVWISAGVMGLIVMVLVYVGLFYRKQIRGAGMYYLLMQLSVLMLLYHEPDMAPFGMMDARIAFLAIWAHGIFAVLFSLAFVEARSRFRRVYAAGMVLVAVWTGLLVATWLGLIDEVSVLLPYALMPLWVGVGIWMGVRRYREGMKAARYYVAGWTVLALAFGMMFLDDGECIVVPVVWGVALEAVLFAAAIAAKEHAYKQLLIQRAKLASIGEMIGHIAHQWRQPLSQLGFTLLNIRAASTPLERDRCIEEAEAYLEHLSQTIEDFRRFYLPHNPAQSVDLHALITQAVSIVDDGTLAVDIHAPNPAYRHLDANAFKHLMLILLTNAKEAIDTAMAQQDIEKGRVTITITQKKISVCDNGMGIDTRVKERIFEPYVSTKAEGMGIGLAIASELAEHLGTRLRLAQRGEGTCFELVW